MDTHGTDGFKQKMGIASFSEIARALRKAHQRPTRSQPGVPIVRAQEHACEVARCARQMEEIERVEVGGDLEEDVDRQGEEA
jgi:hypothetical protein